MARILYWNINNFSLNKVDDPNNPADSHDRRAHIVDEVMRGLPAPPDIFVIVEVFARTLEVGTEGVPVIGNARAGALELLRYIRQQLHANWMLVPPVWSGSFGFGEGVAVYYDSNTMRFTGPYRYGPDFRTAGRTRTGAWRTPPTERACPLADTAQPAMTPPLPPAWITGPQNYPAAWNNSLGTRVGGGLPNERQCAGQYEFYTAAGARISFPSSFHRSPFLTTFRDLNVGGAGLTIKLFAMHTSPGFANRAVEQLPNVLELAPALNEVSVVVGDFNADSFNSRAAYDGLIGPVGGPAGPMTMLFTPDNGGATRANRRPYLLTHYLPTSIATPNGTQGGVAASPLHDVYPRFGYMGTMGGFLFQTPTNAAAIDNVLMEYGGGTAVAPVAHNATIVNKVVGTPYAGVAPPPANVTAELTGGLASASSLANGIPQPNGEDSTAGGNAALVTQFQSWVNFGRIRSTSDHLPLVVDI